MLLEDAARRTQAIKGTATISLTWSVTNNIGLLFQIIGQMVELSEGTTAATVASTAALNANSTACARSMITAATAIGRAANKTAEVCSRTNHPSAAIRRVGNIPIHHPGRSCVLIQPTK
jgi:hypothetical protein